MIQLGKGCQLWSIHILKFRNNSDRVYTQTAWASSYVIADEGIYDCVLIKFNAWFLLWALKMNAGIQSLYLLQSIKWVREMEIMEQCT